MKFYSKKLKKFFAMICAFCLIVEFSLSGIPVKAAEPTPKITYTVTGEATVGKQITISLNVSNISGLYGGSWDFAYDPSIIKVDEITSGELTSSIPQITTSNKSGHAYFWFTKTGDTTGVSTTEAKSIAKIKATVLKEGTININTTNSDNSFGVNNKSSLVKLSDKNGDKIGYSNEDKSITIINDAITSYEENNSLIKYNGYWNTDNNTANSNLYAKYSNATGNSITFAFNGTGFKWYGYSNDGKGIANVYIDDKKIEVDTYSSSKVYQKLFYETNSLSDGYHTVKIEVSGKKNPKSTNTFINFDKVSIINGTLAPVQTINSYEENNSLIKYNGYWNTDNNTANSNLYAKYSNATGNSITFAFNGTGFKWYGYSNDGKGIANVYIDDKKIEVDTYSSSKVYQKLFYETNSLSDGYHTVKIEVSGKKNPKSTNTFINFDKVSIINGTLAPVQTINSYEENNSLIKYNGYWNTDNNTANSNLYAKYSNATGNSITFAFNGTGFKWYGYSNDGKGIANVYIDDKKIEVDTYSSSKVYQKLFYETNSLSDGYHTVKIEVSGKKNPKSTNTFINFDKVSIINGTLAPVQTINSYEENNSLIKYNGYWNTDNNTANSNLYAKYSNATGNSITFAFNGTGFKWYGYSNDGKGIANVYIDDKKIEVDTYSSSKVYQKLFYETNSLSDGYHTVKIEVSGKKNPKSTNTFINFDKVSIINGTLVAIK